jgi:hypothetical protein
MSREGPTAHEVSVRFERNVWQEEVGRLRERAYARVHAERSRREIEAAPIAELGLLKCKSEGDDGTSLPGCVKAYVPLGRQSASDAPFGFVFQLAQDPDGGLVWNFIAFGERHPENPATRTVYERAHRRLHGRYP